MPHEDLIADLKAVFHRHGRASNEDQDWSAMASLQVLTLEVLEVTLTTVNELQQKVNGLSDKLSGVEADVKDLVAKSGGSSPAAPGGLAISQDQLDSMGSTLDGVMSRMDALRTEMTSPPSAAPPPSDTTAPSGSPPSQPSAPSSPPPGASS